MTRVGAVDLGTNSVRLLVADVQDGQVDEEADRVRPEIDGADAGHLRG